MNGTGDTGGTITGAPGAPSGVWPTLRYQDAQAAITFLTDVLGLRPTCEVPAGEGIIAHAELVWPQGGAVMVASSAVDEGSNDPLPPGVGAVYLVTPDIRAAWQRVTDAGVEAVRPLHEADYGSTTFTIRDPEGVYWTIGTYAGA